MVSSEPMTPDLAHREAATIYLHFPCFDGIVSGALTILYLEKVCGWRFESINPVNYNIQSIWLTTRLPRHSCVVDFLYHPEAEFWCDHHPTSFLNSTAREDFAAHRTPFQLFDQESPSSARLIWNKAAVMLDRSHRLQEMVDWASRIDTASYTDVHQALFGVHSALQINRSLEIDSDPAYCGLLVRKLCLCSLDDLAAHPEVQQRLVRADDLTRKGLERVADKIHLYDNIAVFDVLTGDTLVSRYSAFYFHPGALISIGTLRSADSIIVRVNANPWLHFDCPNLGQLIRSAAASTGLGSAGGGHSRVGSLILSKDSSKAAEEVVSYLIRSLHDVSESGEKAGWQKAATQ
jgi:hypothetical protein